MADTARETKKTSKRRHDQVNSTTTLAVVNHDHLLRYSCKTCQKKFTTYQALGGHQGVHKKVKLEDDNDESWLTLNISGSSSELHRCRLCGKGFPTGQALGGHMRRHRIEKGKRVKEEEREESGVTTAEVVPLRVKVEEDDHGHDHHRLSAKRELVLAAREWRLSI